MSNSLEKELNSEELKSNRNSEVERILECHDFDHFSILQLDITDFNDDNIRRNVKKSFRKRSLMIHPDKVDHESAPVAFEKLKRAEKTMSVDIMTPHPDDASKSLITEKQRLIDIYKDVTSKPDFNINAASDSNLADEQVQKEVARILDLEIKQVEVETKFQQRQEAKRQEDLTRVARERELKKQMESKWEDKRDLRVQNWRKYNDKVEKKKSKKKKKATLEFLA